MKYTWKQCVTKVKKAIANKHPLYSQKTYINIKIGTTQMKVRCDCSGYVSACIELLRGKTFCTSSYGFSKDPSVQKIMESLGFKKIKFTSWEDCKKYDIVSQAGKHVEIFDHYDGENAYVYSNGSTKGIANVSFGKEGGSHKYDTIWRYAK